MTSTTLPQAIIDIAATLKERSNSGKWLVNDDEYRRTGEMEIHTSRAQAENTLNYDSKAIDTEYDELVHIMQMLARDQHKFAEFTEAQYLLGMSVWAVAGLSWDARRDLSMAAALYAGYLVVFDNASPLFNPILDHAKLWMQAWMSGYGVVGSHKGTLYCYEIE